jgi:hypothetical protein
MSHVHTAPHVGHPKARRRRHRLSWCCYNGLLVNTTGFTLCAVTVLDCVAGREGERHIQRASLDAIYREHPASTRRNGTNILLQQGPNTRTRRHFAGPRCAPMPVLTAQALAPASSPPQEAHTTYRGKRPGAAPWLHQRRRRDLNILSACADQDAPFAATVERQGGCSITGI